MEHQKREGYRLYEAAPAGSFEEAHLLGNGSLGASVFGGIPHERILINHDSLWSGSEDSKLAPKTLANFPEARRLTLEGKYWEATDLINREMLGYWTESYLPLGYLNLSMGLTEDRRSMTQKRILENEFPAENYRRELSLEDAAERISYDQRGRHYTRTYFVSHPDNALCMRLTATGGSLDFALSMDSPLRHEQLVTAGTAAIAGRAPDRVEPYEPRYTPNTVYRQDGESRALRFAAVAAVADTDGRITTDGLRCYVVGASYAVIVMTAETNFAGLGQPRDPDPMAVLHRCREALAPVLQKSFEELYQGHWADYRRLYADFSLELGTPVGEALPTSERMARIGNLEDPSLLALVVQYSRYLLIASSRAGTQAANLQGIWNPNPAPSWAGNYTTNINVEMNYWGAEQFGLPECHLPLIELVRGCAQTGREAAQKLYGMAGWVTHHNTDFWRFAGVAGEDASWAWWCFGGFWMCAHLMEHYRYQPDPVYLRETVYPILCGAVEFLCDFVVKDRDGFYVTAPSTSPENKFFIGGATVSDSLEEVRAGNRFSPNRTDTAEISKAATLDLALIREVFQNYRETAEILETGLERLPRMEEILAELTPFKIGKYGQLQEWTEDFEECSPGMEHLSHLYPVYPGAQITREETPVLFEGARLALNRRARHGAGGSGWPGAWQIPLWARFGQGEKCEEINVQMPQRLGPNFLTRGALQIDAVLGWGAGIGEMLLQSHTQKIRILPALPTGWRDGKVQGFRARGGFTLDFQWRDGLLRELTVYSDQGGDCVLAYLDKEYPLSLAPGECCSLSATELGTKEPNPEDLALRPLPQGKP